MSKDIVETITKISIDIDDIIKSIEEDLSNLDSLTTQEIVELNNEIQECEIIMNKIKGHCKIINSKVKTLIVLKDPILKNKLKDKTSFEFNNLLLSQGKPAKALYNLEEKAKKGDLESQFLTGRTYLNGVVGHYGDIKMRDVALGLKWLAIAYKAGKEEAGFLIAKYEKSVLNTESAIKIFEKLGSKGHLKSLEELLHIYKTDPKHENMERVLEIKHSISNI